MSIDHWERFVVIHFVNVLDHSNIAMEKFVTVISYFLLFYFIFNISQEIFKQSDFKSDIDYENIGTCHFPCLNIGAVPSLHLSNSELEQESVPDLNTECDIETKPHLSNNPITVVSKYLRVLLSINFPKDSTLKF